jgi:putative CocE/NonD family hydrolase
MDALPIPVSNRNDSALASRWFWFLCQGISRCVENVMSDTELKYLEFGMTEDFDHPPALDNLIQLKTDLSQAQTAGWTPGAPVYTSLGHTVHAGQMIAVADGVALSADISTPKTTGRYPAVIAFAAYSHQLQSSGAPTGTSESGEPQLSADRGYNHVIVSRRGMGRSQGESVIFFNETDVDDHVDVIEWCARQPWCDGNIVLFGTSYYAVVQPLVAVRQPPALKGFFGNGTDTDYFRQIVMTGGAPQVDFLTLWMGANFTVMQEKIHVPPIVRAALSHVLNSPLKHLWQPVLQKQTVQFMNGFKKQVPDLKYRKLFADWVFDGKSRATHSIPSGPYAELDKINVPFVLVEDMGAMNLHQFGAYDLFENAGTPANLKWLIMTPPEYALPVYRWQLEALAFFDHVVHGAENGYADQAPVRYLADGAAEGEYRSAKNFPIPGSTKIRFYLATGGDDQQVHKLSNTPGEGKNSWGAVPFGAIVPSGLDEAANPILTFEPLIEEDVQYAGPSTASLSFSCSEIDSHVLARLGRVDNDGNLHQLSMGSIRPALRRRDKERSTACEIALSMDNPEPLEPYKPVTLLFSLSPRPVLLKVGEKLRLDIASRTDLLFSDVAHGYEQFQMVVPPYFSRNTLHYGPDTFIEVDNVT